MIELLLSLIVVLTGIQREVDPGLTEIAQRRAIEVQTDWSHNGMVSWTTEVLAFNENSPDPVTGAVHQWRDSPGHWAILTDSSLTRIGCAMSLIEATYYFACVLAGPVIAESIAVEQPFTQPDALPNTATGG